MRGRWLVGTLAIAACNDLSIDGEVVFTGAHLTLHADPALPLCGEPVARADAYLETLGAFLETPIPAIEYYLHDATTVSCAPLGGDAIGCTLGDDVSAITWIEYHELVHAVIDNRWGAPPALLIEGIAEALAKDYPVLSPEERARAPVDDLLDSARFHSGSVEDVADHYIISGDFTAYVVRRFGAVRFRRLYERLLFLGDPLTFRKTFREVMDADLAAVIADWRAEANGDGLPLMPRAALRCGAPPIAASAPDAFRVSEPLCASGFTANGGVLDQPVLHAFTLTRSGLYAVRPTVTGSEVAATLTDCVNGRTAVSAAGSTATPVTFVASLGAGLHGLELASLGPLDAPASATFELARLGADSATCEAAPTVTAGDARPAAIVLDDRADRWPGRVGDLATTWLRVTVPIGGDLFALWRTRPEHAPATSVRICEGTCEAPTACTLVGGSPPATKVSVPAGATLLLELQAPLGSKPQLQLVTP